MPFAREGTLVAAREQAISQAVSEYVSRLQVVLREDFHLTDEDTAARVLAHLQEFEKCSTSGCTQDAIGIALHDGGLSYHCAVHVG